MLTFSDFQGDANVILQLLDLGVMMSPASHSIRKQETGGMFPEQPD
jgi:hypothetical protein